VTGQKDEVPKVRVEPAPPASPPLRQGGEEPPPQLSPAAAGEGDDGGTAFPAAEGTPGQAESRGAWARFQEQRTTCPWWEEFLGLRREGFTWRVAAWIAWAASPARGRWPETQLKLATDVLGLKADRVIAKWRAKDPRIDERIARLQVEPLMRHRRDVIEALVTSASDPDPKSHPDRRMFLEMTGDYQPRGAVQAEVTVADAGQVRAKLAQLLGAEPAGGREAAAAGRAER